jgi:glycosyltransferase involved in cell wall biosynthesis
MLLGMQENEMLVSVIIPTKNRCKLLVRAIESVWEQTWKNMEVIVVNDNSTDDTSAVLKDTYGDSITVINNKESQGGAIARNQGIAQARGKYIAFLDDDDTWIAEKIEMQVNGLILNPDASVITCSYYSIHTNGRKNIVNVSYIPGLLLQDNYLGGASMYLTTKKNLEKIGGFTPGLRSGQDWDLLIRLNEIGRIKVMDIPLVNYYEHNEARITNLMSSYLGRRDIFLAYRNKMEPDKKKKVLSELVFYRIRLRKKHSLFLISRLFLFKGKVPYPYFLRLLARYMKFYITKTAASR